MHYSELADLIGSKVRWNEMTQSEAIKFVELKNALLDGQGYVAIILNPDGLQIVPVAVEGNSQRTIRAKQSLRKIVRDVISGMPTSSRSRMESRG